MDGVQIYYAASKQIANVSHKIANISQQIANVSHKMANVSQQIANEDGGGESSLPLACCTGQTADGRCSSGSNWGLRPAATLAAGSGGTRRGGGGCPQRPLVVGRGDGDGAGLPGRPGGFESSPSPPHLLVAHSGCGCTQRAPMAGTAWWVMVQRRGAAWEVGWPRQLPIPPPRGTRQLSTMALAVKWWSTGAAACT
jgi:hypothetical protein